MKRRNQLMIAAGILSAAGAAFAGQKYGRKFLRQHRQDADETSAQNGADTSGEFRQHKGVSSPHGGPVTAH
ncbi:hypothetical protein [uncultured Hyphomonas sp.]|jgi:hypothetical protein|uniref:hypothetical protein n=1 Tax=uncultured Hyphomonas sp. TaxID=225298 RepID=UPI0030DB7E09|tara:strand:+ start:893 stop:1105 length:213 start_codon:yes stop_codon:yes gene_type:complete